MRRKRIIEGMNNSQKIRVILNGIGFHTTIEGMTEMPFTGQRVAVWNALDYIALQARLGRTISGYGSSTTFYNDKMQPERIDFQVDLV